MKIEGKISEKPDERLILIIICDHKKANEMRIKDTLSNFTCADVAVAATC